MFFQTINANKITVKDYNIMRIDYKWYLQMTLTNDAIKIYKTKFI